MQKYAAADAIWLSEDLYNALDDRTGFGPADAEVDGLRVYAWKAPVTAA